MWAKLTAAISSRWSGSATQAAVQNLRGTASGVLGAWGGRAGSVGARVGGLMDKTASRTVNAANGMVRFAKDRPLVTLGVAAGGAYAATRGDSNEPVAEAGAYMPSYKNTTSAADYAALEARSRDAAANGFAANLAAQREAAAQAATQGQPKA